MFGLFEKKVLVELPDGSGGTKKIKISKEKLDELLKSDGVQKLITVHVCCPIKGYYTEGWEADQINGEAYAKFRDEGGDLYVGIHYENGEPITHLMSKELWTKMNDEMEEVSSESNRELNKVLKEFR